MPASLRMTRRARGAVDAARSRLERGLLIPPDAATHGTTLIAFGGAYSAFGGIPPFEFLRIAEPLAARRVFVRDPRQRFYHYPIRGLGATIPDKVRTLRKVSRNGPLVVVGNSAGGFAALLFGALLDADVVLAFSPRTTIDQRHYVAAGEAVNSRVRAVNRNPRLQRDFFDLATILRQAEQRGAITVVYPRGNSTDRWHAERLRQCPAVQLRPMASDSHGLVRDLRDSGELLRLLGEGIQQAEKPAPDGRADL